MENNIIIEQMTSKDIDGVFEVEKNCFEHHWSKDAFKKELNNDVARYLVAKIDVKNKEILFSVVEIKCRNAYYNEDVSELRIIHPKIQDYQAYR